jgi:NAD(P)-dependent dehydrogenase (short-subunit alcohol dehydrogenase family)
VKIDLSGRIAVVTGAASGIGARVAKTLAAAGASVIVGDSSPAAVTRFAQENPTIAAVVSDVGEPDQVDALFAEAEKKLGPVNTLINNAGIAGPTSKVEEMSIEGWERTLKVNLSGAFFCVRRCVPGMLKARSGAIVNISSVAGRLGFPFRLPYAATKWGLIGMTETLAMELGSAGIRVNAVLPGLIDNERAREIVAGQAKSNRITEAEALERFMSRISMRTLIQPEEVAATVAFLVSDFGRHISGQSLSVCGNFEGYASPDRSNG